MGRSRPPCSTSVGAGSEKGPDFGDLIRRLSAELLRWGDGWERRAHELARKRLDRPEDFLEWAKRDGHWSFTMAEVLTRVRPPRAPAEIARRLLVTILGELREERTVFAGSV